MATPIDPPTWGWWPYNGFPDVANVGGRRYRKAVLKQAYDGVVEQYREDVDRKSRHLKVHKNGTFSIDHIDDDNPDRGRPVQHFFSDHPLAGIVGLGLAIGAVVLLARTAAR